MVEGEVGADAEAEAFFSKEGGTSVLDFSALTCAVPVQCPGEVLSGLFVGTFKVIDRTCGDGEMGGFGPEFAIGHLLGNHFDEKVLLVKVVTGN